MYEFSVSRFRVAAPDIPGHFAMESGGIRPIDAGGSPIALTVGLAPSFISSDFRGGAGADKAARIRAGKTLS
jgi:hypothetical protein